MPPPWAPPDDWYTRMGPFVALAAANYELACRIIDFYRTSDNPSLTARWCDFFTPDATIKIGNLETGPSDELRTMGPEERIQTLRLGMWRDVLMRRHWVTGAAVDLSAGGPGTEHLLKGGVRRVDTAGNQSIFSWQGSARWVKEEDGKWRMANYVVLLAPWTPANGEVPPGVFGIQEG